MKAQEIFNILRAGGLTRAGSLGMIGNMYAESTLKENIAQRGATKLTDEQYTAAADNSLLDFANDSVGYGLCQWTLNARKKALLTFAKENGVSVGDGPMQVNFCLKELTEDFSSVYDTLCTSDSIDECADLICIRFEMPAVNNLEDRRNFAHQAEALTADQTYTPPIKNPISATFPPDPSVFILQMVMQYNGYWEQPDGYKSKEFFASLRRFTADMEGC